MDINDIDKRDFVVGAGAHTYWFKGLMRNMYLVYSAVERGQ